MKWIKSIDQLPPKDRSFIGYDAEYDQIDAFEYEGPFPSWETGDGILLPGRYTSIGSCDGCQHVLEEHMTHWMELPEKPDAI